MSLDPTAIDLQIDWSDPLHHRISGTVNHSGNWFDAPYMQEIDDVFGDGVSLWVGGGDKSFILPDHILHYFCMSPWHHYQIDHDIDTQVVMRLHDSRSQETGDKILAVAAMVVECAKEGPTFVHCQAGLNRSNLVVATAMVLYGWDADEAIAYLREQRRDQVLCNPAFVDFVRGV